MARIVILGASQAVRTQLTRLLNASGFQIFRACATDGEARRALTECTDGIVLIAGNVPGCLPGDLAQDFGGRFRFLLIGRPDTLSACDAPEVFKLSYPCSGSALVGAMEMLTQLHHMRLPKRSGQDRDLVDQAKQLLMRRQGIDEAEAHRRLQRLAMRRGMKMTDCALEIIQGGLNDA